MSAPEFLLMTSNPLSFGKQLIRFGNDLESVGHIKDIGFTLRPTTVGIEADGATFAYKTPADGVRLFAMAAGSQPFWMTRSGAGLADLVEVAHVTDHFTLAGLVNQRLAAAERCFAVIDEIEDQPFGFLDMQLAVSLDASVVF